MTNQLWNHRPDLNTRTMFIRSDDHESGHVFSTSSRRTPIDFLPVAYTLTGLFVIYCILAIAGILP